MELLTLTAIIVLIFGISGYMAWTCPGIHSIRPEEDEDILEKRELQAKAKELGRSQHTNKPET